MIPRVRLSPKYATGTIQQREKCADDMCAHLFSKVFALYKKTDRVDFGRIEEESAFAIPETIDFKVRMLSKKEAEKGIAVFNSNHKDNKITDYTIGLPLTLLGKLDIECLPSFLHENTHMFDCILQPKINKNCENLLSRNLYKFADNLFEKKYYTTLPLFGWEKQLKKTKKQTKKAIAHLPVDDKLLILNYIKNGICLEHRAIKNDIRCAP